MPPKYFISSWDEYYLSLALLASRKSKDPATKVGCILVHEDGRQVAMGFNGFLPKIDESNFTWNKTSENYSENKYAYVLHAEENAILHSQESLDGATAYVTLFPCNRCALMLAKKKIKKIVYLDQGDTSKEYYKASIKILKAANIDCVQYDIDKIKDVFCEVLSSF